MSDGWLELLSTDAPVPWLTPGERFRISGEPILGRYQGDPVFFVPGAMVSRRHCQLVQVKDRWTLVDLSDNGTYVNGERVHSMGRTLEHGDVLSFPGAVSLRFLEREWTQRFNADLEAAISAQPEDDGARLVYADWLQEHGDPLGNFMVEPRPTDITLARWLGPLAGPWRAGVLSVEWKHGFLHTVRLSNVAASSSWHAGVLLSRLFEHRLAKWLRALDFEPLGFSDLSHPGAEQVAPVTEWLGFLAPRLPASVVSLRTGPWGPVPWNEVTLAFEKYAVGSKLFLQNPRHLVFEERSAELVPVQLPERVSIDGAVDGRWRLPASAVLCGDGERVWLDTQANATGFNLRVQSQPRSVVISLATAWPPRRLLVNGRNHSLDAPVHVGPGDLLEPVPGYRFKVVGL